MFQERKIVLRLDAAHIQFPDKGVDAAIGYLASWAFFGTRFPEVRITSDRDANLSAWYMKEDGSVGYEIFGYRREDGSYSFHS